MKRFLIVFSILCGAALAQNCQTATWECAPRQSASQLTSIPLPNPLPNFGNLVGANTRWYSPIFNDTTVRCTDINSSPDTGFVHSYEVTDTGGNDFPVVSSDGKRLRVMYSNSGASWEIPVDPVAMTCGTAIPGSHAPAGVVSANTDPNVDYALQNGTTVIKRTFNGLQPPVSSVFFDFKMCPGLANISPSWHSGLQILGDDSLFAVALSDRGGQNTGEWIAMYQPASGGCQTKNTLTGQIIGNGFGQTGMVTPFFSYTLHNIEMGPGGVISESVGTCALCTFHNAFSFKAGTLVDVPPVRNASGHGCLGYAKGITANGGLDYSWAYWDNQSVLTTIVHVQNVPWKWPAVSDVHIGCRNFDELDSFPFFVSSTSVTNPPYSGDAPLMREIFLVDFAGNFRRTGPTFSSGVPNEFNFRTANAIGDISKQGCIFWSSDAMGSLGNTDGVHAACTLGAPPPNECRSDVFMRCPGR